MDIHELANIFPMLGDEELKELCADIEKNGLAEPITVYEVKILDGRNRWTACQKLGIEPKTIEYTGNDPLAFVLSKNLHRRHLTTSQRAMIAEKLATIQRGGDRKSGKIKGQNCPLISQSEAAKQLNVSGGAIKKARKVRTKAVPEVAKAVETGKLPVSAAAKLADAPPEEQREAIARVERGEKRPTAKSPPKRKTIAEERNDEDDHIKVEKKWSEHVNAMMAWWDTMPKAYEQLTGGEEMTGCMQIPVPFHHNVLMAMFRQMCDEAGDAGEELRQNFIAEVKLLAERIDELND